MHNQKQAERFYEYRPQRKAMKLVGILFMIMPVVGVPVLLYGEVQPVTLLGFDLNATWSAVVHIGMGICIFLLGAVFLANALRKVKAEKHIQLTIDRIIFPDIKTGNSEKSIAYSDISEASVEDKGKRKLLRLTYSDGSSVLDSSDMESLVAFEEMNEALQQYLMKRN